MRVAFSFVLGVGILLSSSGQANTIALKNFREILVSMSVSTGVFRNDADVQEVYQRVKTRLPVNGEVGEMSSPMVLGVTELAGVFCDKMIRADSALDPEFRQAHREVDFRRGPGYLDDEVIESVAMEYSDLFWLRAPSAEELDHLKMSIANARDGSASSTAGATIEVLKIGCAVTATSLAALLN